jgi:hypothetical protein
MKKLLFVSTFLLVLFVQGWSQNNIPDDYFSNPLDIPLVLAGNFGELRSNHFHSGIDIKTKKREGIPIYAPADGYVKRIKVSLWGYGKALYIQHPNGYTTVYAHLKDYAGKIQDYVKSNQYKKETFTLELFPDKSELPVKKGDLIGYTGNSGSSGGPHLHFEIRDASSRPMNPMLFGIDIPDTKKPIVGAVFAYSIGENAHVNQSQNRVKLRLILQKDGSYKAENIYAFGKIGFGLTASDQQNNASNKNGIYKVVTHFNGEKKYEVTFNKFSFAETKYLNRFIDYSYFKTNRSRIQKLFRETNNPLSIITYENQNGYITLDDGFNASYTILVTDFKGNNVKISVPIIGKKMPILYPKKIQETQDFVYANQAFNVSKGKFSVFLPANSLYEDTFLDIQDRGDTLHLHKDTTPLHKRATITIDASNYDSDDLDKLFVGKLNYKGDPYYNSSYRKDNKIIAKVKEFGDYALVIDTVPPTISPLNFSDKKWISKNKTLKLKIKDELSGISTYRATINGKFILMEYNPKKDVLSYDFNDGIISETENKLKLIVVDNVGNSTTFEATFYRKTI